MPAETYASTAYGAVRRIRTPHEHDVLSGRGGGINNHVGNQVFRQWVAERKEDYNLAPNKLEKTHVALEVMDKVRNQNPPGRFLQRDPTVMTGPVWWVEVDEARALAKTSQALREGAPQIRLAHKEELSQRVNKSKRSSGKRKRKTETAPPEVVSEQPAPAVLETPPLRPLVEQMPTDDYKRAIECLEANVKEAKDQHEKIQQGEDSQQQHQSWDSTTKKSRYSMDNSHMSLGNDHYETAPIDDLAETPPLLSMPPPPERMETLNIGSAHKSKEVGHQASNALAPSMKGLPRVHSLALSDFSMADTNIFDDDGEFINPFEDESNIANTVLRSRQTSNGNKRYPSGYLRNLSSEESINPEPGVDRSGEEEHRSPDRSNPGLTTDENDHDDVFFHGSWETDFGEGMKSILDIVHPDLTSPEMGEKLPTLLFPWRGSGGSSGILSNFNHSNSRRGLLYDGRQ